MLAILLAAAMFPAHVVIPFPGAVRLAIIQAAVVAASNGGEGAIFVRHEGGTPPARNVNGPWYTLDYDLVIEPGEQRFPVPPIC